MLYDKIKSLCAEKGLTIAKLERDAGIANGTIDGWNAGTPNIRTLKAVADVLQISVDDLISGIDFNKDATSTGSRTDGTN